MITPLRKTFYIATAVSLLFFWFLAKTPNTVRAAFSCVASPNLPTTAQKVTVSLTTNESWRAGQQYKLVVERDSDSYVLISDPITLDSNGNFSKEIGPFGTAGGYNVDFYRQSGSVDCSTGFNVSSSTGEGACPLTSPNAVTPHEIYEDTPITVFFEPVSDSSDSLRKRPESFVVRIDNTEPWNFKRLSGGTQIGPGGWQANIGTLEAARHELRLYFFPDNVIPPATPKECYPIASIVVQEGNKPDGNGDGTTIFPDEGGAHYIDTPFGPISTDPAGVAKALLNLGVGVAGGIAFLLMVFGAYRLIFAGGNPEAIQQGSQVITAAIIGLLVIVFSVFILNLIGISILGLKIGL